MDKVITRNSNIELLRIIAMCGVIALHYNFGRAFNFVDINSINGIFLLFIESVFSCCVNLFLIISGYFSWGKTSFSVIKAVDLIVEVILIRFVFTVVKSIISGDISFKRIASSFIPLNYYVILFISVMLLSPYINFAVQKFNNNNFRTMLTISFILFSVIPYIIDSIKFTTGYDLGDISPLARFGSSYGYSFINFLLMYLIGAYIGKSNNCRCKKAYAILLLVLWIILVFIGYIALKNNIDINLAYSYCNPLVISTAVLSFIAFKDIEIRKSNIINKIASGAFTVYLTHGYFLDYLHIEQVANANIVILFGHLLLSIILLYCFGYLISVVLNVFIKFLNRFLKKLPIIRSVQ